MLNFLRKHQRLFFIVITVAIVISFCFFGTYSTLARHQDVPDRKVVCGVCGSPIMQQELSALCRLIESSPFDRSAWEKGALPNFLNDGVVERDFLATGLAAMLAKGYLSALKSDFEPRIKKIQAFRPYVHPHSSQISAEKAWGRYAPPMLEHLHRLKEKGNSLSSESLELIIQLYMDQVSLPPDVLKQILTMQQNQTGIGPDPVLVNSDLSLFGFKSIEDWFGSHFVSAIGQFILNAAQIAEEKGYEIKKEEVRADLYQNIYRSYQEIYRKEQMTAEEIGQYYQAKMRHLGLDENMLLHAWTKVMLFRRLFEDGSGSVLIDPLVYEQFNQYAKENVLISLYQLPRSLQLEDFRSMLKLQVYLESIALDPANLRKDLKLPEQFASIEQIEKRVPELVERQVELEWSEVSKEELCRLISIKETCEWESSEANWELIKTQFSELVPLKSQSPQERLAILDKLDKKFRFKVDQFARKKIVDGHSERIHRALDLASVNHSSISLRLKGSVLPFKDDAELISLLEKSALKDEVQNAYNQQLECYTPDREHYYRISVLRREKVKKVIAFEEACRDGTLDKLLDKRLEGFYPEIRKKQAQLFQQSDGQFKPFSEVKDQVGKFLFSDLLRSIEEHYRAYFGILPGKAGELPLNFYSSARLLPHMNAILNRLKSNENPLVLNAEENLSSQWVVEKTEETMERSSKTSFSKEEMFTLSPQQWSPVKIGEKGALAFYIVLQKGKVDSFPLQTLEQGHQILSHDAKRDMMFQVFQKIQQKKAIDLTARTVSEAKEV